MEHTGTHPLKTFLYEEHLALGAKMVPFANYLMPVQYKSALVEHKACRTAASLFDVSHMGRIDIHGTKSSEIIDFLSVNTIKNCPVGSCVYTVLCKGDARAIDDVIVMRRKEDLFSIVANASNKHKVLAHLKEWGENLSITPNFDSDGILSLQGPKAEKMLAHFFSEALSLKPMRLIETSWSGIPLIVSTTGYTGERGFEIMGPNGALVLLWELLVKEGAVPTGLAARDSLRLEMGYALFGHEMSEKISVVESVASWTISWDRDFLGKEHLKHIKDSPEKRHPVAIKLHARAIAREGAKLFVGSHERGFVTSGGFSPILECPIALGLVSGSVSKVDSMEVEVRGERIKAEQVPLPFYKKDKR